MNALTAKELLDEIRSIRPHVERLTNDYLTAANRYVVARRNFDIAEANAFLKAKQDGATDEMAKRIALIKASDEKEVMEQLLEEKRAAKLGSDSWRCCRPFLPPRMRSTRN